MRLAKWQFQRLLLVCAIVNGASASLLHRGASHKLRKQTGATRSASGNVPGVEARIVIEPVANASIAEPGVTQVVASLEGQFSNPAQRGMYLENVMSSYGADAEAQLPAVEASTEIQALAPMEAVTAQTPAQFNTVATAAATLSASAPVGLLGPAPAPAAALQAENREEEEKGHGYRAIYFTPEQLVPTTPPPMLVAGQETQEKALLRLRLTTIAPYPLVAGPSPAMAPASAFAAPALPAVLSEPGAAAAAAMPLSGPTEVPPVQAAAPMVVSSNAYVTEGHSDGVTYTDSAGGDVECSNGACTSSADGTVLVPQAEVTG